MAKPSFILIFIFIPYPLFVASKCTSRLMKTPLGSEVQGLDGRKTDEIDLSRHLEWEESE